MGNSYKKDLEALRHIPSERDLILGEIERVIDEAPGDTDTLRAYLIRGQRPGDFLYAVLCNNLGEAALLADRDNTQRLAAWGKWIMTVCPANARGSRRTVDNWMLSGGYQSMLDALPNVTRIY